MSYTGFGATTGGIQYSAGLFRGQAEANARREALAQRKSELAQRMQMAQQEFAAKQMQMQADNAFRDKAYRDKQKAYADSLLYRDKNFDFMVDKYKKGLDIDEERYQDKLNLADRSFNANEAWKNKQFDASQDWKNKSFLEQQGQNLFNQNMAIDKLEMLKQSYEDKRKQNYQQLQRADERWKADLFYKNKRFDAEQDLKKMLALQAGKGKNAKPMSMADQQILAEAEVTVGDPSRTPQERAVAANLIASATGRQSFIGDMPESQEMGWLDRGLELAKPLLFGGIPSLFGGDSRSQNISQAWNAYTQSGAQKEINDLENTKKRILRIAKQNEYIDKNGKKQYYVPQKDQDLLRQIESKISNLTNIVTKTNI